jgi:hypothetical protein
LLGSKYRFRKQDVPALRIALGLETDAVRQAFQRFYNKPLASVYQTTLTLEERLRWSWARVCLDIHPSKS